MGCASSALLNRDDDDFSQIGSSAFGHHIVSLTSTTYGLLTLDSPPPTPFRTSKNNAIPTTTTTMSPPTPSPSFSSSDPEVINSWELMAGLDTDSCRFTTPTHTPKSVLPRSKSRFATAADKENSNPNATPACKDRTPIQRMKKVEFEEKQQSAGAENGLQENGVVIYTTTLRGVRKTFEACNAVRAAIQGLGVMVCERDVSMDKGFKEELRSLMSNKTATNKETATGFIMTLPQVFVRGKHIGGAEEVMRMQEEGGLTELLEGLPRIEIGSVCDGCGDIRFLPCFTCYGSCKMVVVSGYSQKETLVVRCPDCNENGLVLCPICC